MSRRRHYEPLPAMPVCSVDDDICKAKAAQADTHRRFKEAALRGPEIRRVASEMKGLRERNGFGELIKESMGLR